MSGYDLYRGTTLAATVTGTAHTDTGLTPSTGYTYTVRARDAAGNTLPREHRRHRHDPGRSRWRGEAAVAGQTRTSSSVEAAEFAAGKAVDGDGATRWASVEGHDPEWITIDLGSTATITRVRLSWEAAYGRAYTDPDVRRRFHVGRRPLHQHGRRGGRRPGVTGKRALRPDVRHDPRHAVRLLAVGVRDLRHHGRRARPAPSWTSRPPPG
ncbi:discoidin domain-containing protein [Nonomuraea dietziae]|uniref:discoidin domain-containing protein n=1 Tax=Nonomuraea dietziae TaxID=65515 RepID=UPI0031DC169F